MELRQLSRHDDRSVTESGLHLYQCIKQALRRFKNHGRACLVAEPVHRIPARHTAPRQKPLVDKAVQRKPGHAQGCEHGRRPRNGSYLKAGIHCASDQRMTGIAHEWSSGIGHERHIFSPCQSTQHRLEAPRRTMIVEGDKGSVNIEVMQ